MLLVLESFNLLKVQKVTWYQKTICERRSNLSWYYWLKVKSSNVGNWAADHFEVVAFPTLILKCYCHCRAWWELTSTQAVQPIATLAKSRDDPWKHYSRTAKSCMQFQLGLGIQDPDLKKSRVPWPYPYVKSIIFRKAHYRNLICEVVQIFNETNHGRLRMEIMAYNYWENQATKILITLSNHCIHHYQNSV